MLPIMVEPNIYGGGIIGFRGQIEDKSFELVKINTHENESDMLIKILPRDNLEVFCLKAGLVIPLKLE